MKRGWLVPVTALLLGLLVGFGLWSRTPGVSRLDSRSPQPVFQRRPPSTLPVERPATLRLTYSGRPKRSLAWSYTGSYLAYQEDSDEVVPGGSQASAYVFVVQADNAGVGKARNPVLVAQDPVRSGDIAWSPDGALLFDLGKVFVVSGPAGEVVNHWYPTVDPAACPAWSPDGRLIYFLSAAKAAGAWNKLLLAFNLDNGVLTEVTRHADPGAVDVSSDPAPRISRAGDLAAFRIGSGDRRTVLVVRTSDGRFVAELQDVASRVTWAPRGARLSYASSQGEVVMVDIVGASKNEMRRKLGVRGPITFSPDGRRLAFATDKVGTGDGLMLLDLAKNRILQIDLGGLVPAEPVWSPDGKSIAFFARSGENEDLYVIPAPPLDTSS